MRILILLLSFFLLTSNIIFSQTLSVSEQLDSISNRQTKIELATERLQDKIELNEERYQSIKDITNLLFWLFAIIAAIGTITGAIAGIKAGRRRDSLHKHALENASISNQISSKFKEIFENINSISNFKVEESKYAKEALEEQAKAAGLLPKIQQKLQEFENERKQQVNSLLDDAKRLIRRRTEYASPNSIDKRLTNDFRAKFDFIPVSTLNKYTNSDGLSQNLEYGEIFLRRGIIAYYDNDIIKAQEMFKQANQFYHSVDKDNIPDDLRTPIAFTYYYLALIEKNYGNLKDARKNIERSYQIWGKNEKEELLTPITRAEILSYSPGHSQEARDAIKQIDEKVKSLNRDLVNHEITYIRRGHLISGNTYYIEKNWEKALEHYKIALTSGNVKKAYNYYALHSLAQVHSKLGNKNESNKLLEKCYNELLDSGHLETKVALDTQITLNALAYLCTKNSDSSESRKYERAVQNLLFRIRKVNELELRLFSLKQKKQIHKTNYMDDLLSSELVIPNSVTSQKQEELSAQQNLISTVLDENLLADNKLLSSWIFTINTNDINDSRIVEAKSSLREILELYGASDVRISIEDGSIIIKFLAKFRKKADRQQFEKDLEEISKNGKRLSKEGLASLKAKHIEKAILENKKLRNDIRTPQERELDEENKKLKNKLLNEEIQVKRLEKIEKLWNLLILLDSIGSTEVRNQLENNLKEIEKDF